MEGAPRESDFNLSRFATVGTTPAISSLAPFLHDRCPVCYLAARGAVLAYWGFLSGVVRAALVHQEWTGPVAPFALEYIGRHSRVTV